MIPVGAASPRLRAAFWGVLAATVAVKLWLAAELPLLGDEAYFILWGRFPALGYYDHPPLVGWILAGLLRLGDSPLLLRLPSVLLAPAIALPMVGLLLRHGARAAYLGGILFLLSPIQVVGVLILTDTPLVLCAALSGFALVAAVEREGTRAGDLFYALSGVCLGMAFLAKYLAVLLGLAYAVWWLAERARGARRPVRGLALLFAGALPAIAFNLGWNATHCWSNVLFNLVSRHAGEGKSYSIPRNLAFYVGTQIYMATPPVLFFLARRRGELRRLLAEPAAHAAFLAFAVPMAALGVAAATLLFGAYWVLAFYPFFFLLLPRVLPERELRRAIAFVAVFTALHLAVLVPALARPLESWREARFYGALVTMEATGEIVGAVAPYREGARLAAPGYSLAALLGHETGEPVAVFGLGSHYARQDDALTDFRALDGGDLLIVSRHPISYADHAPYFRAVETAVVTVRGIPIHLVRGGGFRYALYRRDVLAEIRRRHYAIPPWLPCFGCPFLERYFPGAACGRRDGP